MTSFGWWRDDEPVRFERDPAVRAAVTTERELERQAWQEVDARWGLLSVEDVAAVQLGVRTSAMLADVTGKHRLKNALDDAERARIGHTVEAAALARRAQSGAVLFVGTPLYPQRRLPGFQFSPSGSVLDAMTRVLRVATTRWTPEMTTLWLDAPNGWLAGTAPSDILTTEPEWVLTALARALPTPA